MQSGNGACLHWLTSRVPICRLPCAPTCRLVFSYEILTPAALNFFVNYADGAVSGRLLRGGSHPPAWHAVQPCRARLHLAVRACSHLLCHALPPPSRALPTGGEPVVHRPVL